MRRIRAKMKCASITLTEMGQVVSLQAVTAERPENREWSQYTPSGELRLTVTNPDAFGAIEIGSEYLVDITPA